MHRAILLILALAAACSAPAPRPGRNVPQGAQRYASAVLHAFADADTVAFDTLFPFEGGGDMLRFAASRGVAPVAGFARVLAQDRARALVALSGHVAFGNSGDETGYAEAFSGVYEAKHAGGTWRLTRRVPLDSLARILSQALDVRLEPGHGLDIRDSLVVDVRSDAGFTTQLNHAARIGRVRANGLPVAFAFGGGLLWVPVPRGTAHVVLEYALDVARDSGQASSSAHFAPAYGHVRNPYFWHPRGNGWSAFELRVRAPAHVHVATDLPQHDTVVDGERIVDARSPGPTSALSLAYDRSAPGAAARARPRHRRRRIVDPRKELDAPYPRRSVDGGP